MAHRPSKAHSNEVIDRRLRGAESEAHPDLIELISLHDELARVERKWLEKSAAHTNAPARPNPRPLANAVLHNARMERLTRLITAALRRENFTASPQIAALLEKANAALQTRKPLPETP